MSAPKRLDHGRMYMCIVWALLVWSVASLVVGPIPNSTISELPQSVQSILSLVLFLGAMVKLIGIYSGGRWFMPHTDIRTSYRYAVAAMPAVSGPLIVYVGTIVDTYHYQFWLSALAGALGMGIIAGSMWNAWDFLQEIKRIDRGVEYLKQEKHDDAE